LGLSVWNYILIPGKQSHDMNYSFRIDLIEKEVVKRKSGGLSQLYLPDSVLIGGKMLLLTKGICVVYELTEHPVYQGGFEVDGIKSIQSGPPSSLNYPD
jgi:hypothetical protein